MNDLKEEVLNLKARNEELLQENLDLRDRLNEMDDLKMEPMKSAKQAQKRAVMMFDHLLIDGRKYVLNDDRTGIREAGRRADQ
nr:hypothetical protein BaRGS_003460 [Batillaria attramentaria]